MQAIERCDQKPHPYNDWILHPTPNLKLEPQTSFNGVQRACQIQSRRWDAELQ